MNSMHQTSIHRVGNLKTKVADVNWRVEIMKTTLRPSDDMVEAVADQLCKAVRRRGLDAPNLIQVRLSSTLC